MWKLKIGEGNDENLFSTNNFVGRQIWEFDPTAGTEEERSQVEYAREQFRVNKKKLGVHCCSDLLMRMQLIKESGIDLSEPTVRLGEDEEVKYEAVTTAVRKAVRLNRAIQAWDGHWPAENAGPLFFTPPLIFGLYISGTMDTVLTKHHKKEMIRYMYNHQFFKVQTFWRERNAAIFSNTPLNTRRAANEVQIFAYLWVHNRCSFGKSINWVDWCCNLNSL